MEYTIRNLVRAAGLLTVSSLGGCGVPEGEVEPEVRIGLLDVHEVQAG